MTIGQLRSCGSLGTFFDSEAKTKLEQNHKVVLVVSVCLPIIWLIFI
jgi:hypothetical protein